MESIQVFLEETIDRFRRPAPSLPKMDLGIRDNGQNPLMVSLDDRLLHVVPLDVFETSDVLNERYSFLNGIAEALIVHRGGRTLSSKLPD